MQSIYTAEYYSDLQRKEILSRATIWIRLGDLILSEISNQKQANTIPLI